MPYKRPSLIVAYDRNRGIGFENTIPWLGLQRGDMQHFRNTTMGNIVVMGRKTYESIGSALVGRECRIVTRDSSFHVDDAEVFVNDHLGPLTMDEGDDREIFVIGGTQIYQKYLPAAHEILATEIDASYDVDTYFPELKPHRWTERERTSFESDERNKNPYDIVRYERVCGDYIDTSKARSEDQRAQFEQIELDCLCPFCIENIDSYHERKIVEHNEWMITDNMIPYEGCDGHKLLIPKRHIEHPSLISPDEWQSLGSVIADITSNMEYGGIAFRFGAISHTAASVAHLHIHVLHPTDGSDQDTKVKFKISY